MKRRYAVECRNCGEIKSDISDDGLFDKATAHRRAGLHEGTMNHSCTVEVAEETNEYQCPICHTTVTGKRERNSHAKTEPGLDASSMRRV